MKFKKALQLGVVGLMVANAPAQESEPQAEVVALRATISKIVEVKEQTSAEKSDWKGRKKMMGELLALHQKELALLDEELEKSGQSAKPYDEKKQAAEAAVDELKTLRKETSAMLVQEREKALRIFKMLPPPLREELFPEIETLKKWRSGDEPRAALQALMAVLAKATQFNRRVTMLSEERGGEEVAVLYLGLARAYYVSPTGKAGVGDPTPQGWKWQERAGLASAVRKAVDQLEEKRPPELVALPLKIKKKEAAK